MADGRARRQSIEEHAGFLNNKISFILEATLGLVSIEQNKIIKLFSVMSVVMMPPTLIASIYGMNFKRFFPELEWEYGYPIAADHDGRGGGGAVSLFQAEEVVVGGSLMLPASRGSVAAKAAWTEGASPPDRLRHPPLERGRGIRTSTISTTPSHPRPLPDRRGQRASSRKSSSTADRHAMREAGQPSRGDAPAGR